MRQIVITLDGWMAAPCNSLQLAHAHLPQHLHRYHTYTTDRPPTCYTARGHLGRMLGVCTSKINL